MYVGKLRSFLFSVAIFCVVATNAQVLFNLEHANDYFKEQNLAAKQQNTDKNLRFSPNHSKDGSKVRTVEAVRFLMAVNFTAGP